MKQYYPYNYASYEKSYEEMTNLAQPVNYT